jgi:antitoxin HicB
VGGALEDSRWNRTHDLHRTFRLDRIAPRLREESAKDAEARFEPCEAAIEPTEIVVMGKRNVGSDFDDLLQEDDLLEEATAVAIKRVIAHQLAVLMQEQGISKVEMARRMATSRAALDRLLDPDNPSVTLQTLQSAAAAVGGRLRVKLEVVNDAA